MDCSRAKRPPDRKSTRLNSSHLGISYAVFCLKKKKHERVGDRGGELRAVAPSLLAGSWDGGRGRSRVEQGAAGTPQSSIQSICIFFFLMIGRPRNSPLFPSPTLSR